MPKNENHYQSFLLRIWRVKDGKWFQWRITLEDTLTGALWSFPKLNALFEHLKSLDDYQKEEKTSTISDQTNTTFTPEEILKRSQENFSGLCHVVTAFLKEQNLSIDEFWSFVGKKYSSGWGQITSAKEVAFQAAFNMVSLGNQLHSLSGDQKQAQAKLSGWQTEDELAFFGIIQGDVDPIWGVFGPIAESLGYTYKWHREGDKIIMVFSR
jgi:hypothetical protein